MVFASFYGRATIINLFYMERSGALVKQTKTFCLYKHIEMISNVGSVFVFDSLQPYCFEIER